MTVLDTSIANVAIPNISGDLGVSVDEGTWVITVFAAANAVSIPLTGWLTQRIGQIKLFVAAILMFVLAVRDRADLADPACRTLAARRGGRPADPPVPGHIARLLPQRKVGDGIVAVGDDRHRRTDRGPPARRLDHR